jgi:hypothetical protein
VLLQLQLLGVLLPHLHLGVQLQVQLRRGSQGEVVQHQPMTRVKKHLQRQRVWLRQLLMVMRGLKINLHLLRLQGENQIAQGF